MTIPSPRGAGHVIDASAIVALLAQDTSSGEWVASTVRGSTLFAPDLMPYEASNILRRAHLAGHLDESNATMAHADLLELPIHLDAYQTLAPRVWELRHSVSCYDAAYVAVAELRDLPLVTLDKRLTRSNGPRCRFLSP